MSSNFSLAIVQYCLTRYGMTTYITFGNIGLLFNIAVFSQPTHRRNPSSLYILTMSICAFIGLNISVIPVIYAIDHPNSLNSSAFYCYFQFYFRHAFNQMMRTLFILACANRYAMSSNQARIRSFSQYKTTIRIIPSVIVFWLSLSIFPTVLFSNTDGKCTANNPVTKIIVSTYILLVLGIIPLISMTIFSILLYTNLKRMRGRIQPIVNENPPINQLLRKRDRDMLRMLLIEIVCYIITTIPTAAMLMYTAITVRFIKDSQRLQIESFVSYFTTIFLLYANNSLSFWIYINASRSFRLEFKNLIIKWYAFITNKQVRINEIN
jgi:hypothetical protein